MQKFWNHEKHFPVSQASCLNICADRTWPAAGYGFLYLLHRQEGDIILILTLKAN